MEICFVVSTEQNDSSHVGTKPFCVCVCVECVCVCEEGTWLSCLWEAAVGKLLDCERDPRDRYRVMEKRWHLYMSR